MTNPISHLQYLFLKKYYHIDTNGPASWNRLSLDKIFGDQFKKEVEGKFVIDFGCGHGHDTEKMAEWGAKLSLGLEIREELVKANKQRVTFPNCDFATTLPPNLESKADIIISIDAFEHFDRPDLMLKLMHDCLRPGGIAHISFGPTWYHPHGGHAFSVFPWSHLLLSESALIKWRNQFYHDGATRFNEVAGGLNQLTISGFEKLIPASGFELKELYCTPIRGKKWLQSLLGRELMTSLVSVRLIKQQI